MKTPAYRFPATLAAALALALLPACQSAKVGPLPPAGAKNATHAQLDQAAAALRLSEQARGHGEAAGHALLAAELCWDLAARALMTHGDLATARKHVDSERLRKIQQRAILRMIELTRDNPAALATARTLTLPGLRSPFRVAIDARNQAVLRDFPELLPATEFEGNGGFRRRITRQGLGLPLVGVNRDLWVSELLGKDDTFKRDVGYTAPRTAILAFGPPPREPGEPRPVRFALVDPRKTSTYELAGRQVPVAADFTAPLMAAYPEFGNMFRAIIAAISPDGWLRRSGFYSLEGYDPERIPVVLVHGLFSTPGMWKDLINEMNATEGIGSEYQFFVFTYPTGIAPAFTASLLRERLEHASSVIPGEPRGLVLIGHSMGGILSRTLATETGRVIWDDVFAEGADRAWEVTNPQSELRRSYVFSPYPGVRRIIFISTPHRGSPTASAGFIQQLSAIVKAPVDLTLAIGQTPLVAMGLVPEKPPTSAQGLSPDNPFLLALDSLPIEAPHHSIIGNRGHPGPLEESSDGVVPYWSAHLESASSELVVPTGHGSFRHPDAVKEVIRILELEADRPVPGNN